MNILLGPFRPQESPTLSRRSNFIRTLRQIVAFWGFFLVIVPAAIVWIELRTPLREYRFGEHKIFWFGIILLTGASFLGLWSAWSMVQLGAGTPLPAACARKLVLRGPYAYIRNPMALSGLGQGFSVGLVLGSPSVLIYSILGGYLWNCQVRPREEADLVSRFGAAYEEYRRHVRCWFPRLTPYRGDEANTLSPSNLS